MKIDGLRTAGSGAEVIMATFGKQEARILFDVLKDVLKRTPNTIETQLFRHRCLNMVKVLGKELGGKGFFINKGEITEPRNANRPG